MPVTAGEPELAEYQITGSPPESSVRSPSVLSTVPRLGAISPAVVVLYKTIVGTPLTIREPSTHGVCAASNLPVALLESTPSSWRVPAASQWNARWLLTEVMPIA